MSRKKVHPALQYAEYLVFRFAVGIVRAIPLDLASSISGKLWRWLAPLNKRHKRALTHLEIAFPQKSAAEHEQIARDMWENLGRVTAESLQLDRLIDPKNKRIQSNAEDVVGKLDPDRGSLILSMHSGNWEICVWPMTERGYNPAGVYQKVKNPLVDDYVKNLRGPLYPGGLHAKSHETGRALVSWVKKGGQLGVLSDQRENKGIAVPFFGRPAPTTPLPAMLAVRLKVPIIIGRVIRLQGTHFWIQGKILEAADTGDTKADIAATTAAIQAQFEEWISEYPEQWMWGHRRWES